MTDVWSAGMDMADIICSALRKSSGARSEEELFHLIQLDCDIVRDDDPTELQQDIHSALQVGVDRGDFTMPTETTYGLPTRQGKDGNGGSRTQDCKREQCEVEEDKSREMVKSKAKRSDQHKEKDNHDHQIKDRCNDNEEVSYQEDKTKSGHGMTHQFLGDDKILSPGSKKYSAMSSCSKMSPVRYPGDDRHSDRSSSSTYDDGNQGCDSNWKKLRRNSPDSRGYHGYNTWHSRWSPRTGADIVSLSPYSYRGHSHRGSKRFWGDSLGSSPGFNRSGQWNVFPFQGSGDVLSNLYGCSITHKGNHFRSTEHAYQYEKAIYHGYWSVAEEILAAPKANDAKRVAKAVECGEEWFNDRVNILQDIVQAKWEQVPEVREVLQKHRKSIIVEAVEGDMFWGSGYDRYTTARTSHEEWPGENHMGKMWMAIRDKELGLVEKSKREAIWRSNTPERSSRRSPCHAYHSGTPESGHIQQDRHYRYPNLDRSSQNPVHTPHGQQSSNNAQIVTPSAFSYPRHNRQENNEWWDDSLPEWDVLPFQGSGDELSNLYACSIMHEGKNFRSAQQAYQYEKAIYHGNWNVAEEILAAPTANDARRAAKAVKCCQEWFTVRVKILQDIVQEKWEQVPEVRKILQQHRRSIIVEAVDGDMFWGSGYDRNTTARTSPEEWPGKNHMGKIWMAIRDHVLGLEVNIGENSDNSPAEKKSTSKQKSRRQSEETRYSELPTTPAAGEKSDLIHGKDSHSGGLCQDASLSCSKLLGEENGVKDEGSKHTPCNDLFVYKEKKDQVLCTLYPSKIKYDGKCFTSAEQCFQYQRAIFHTEGELAFKVLSGKLGNNPKQVRKLMKIEDKKSWRRERYEVMKKIAVAKMEQVKEVRQCLEQNLTCVIAQLGTDQDQRSLYWSSGLGRKETVKTPMAKWPGKNKMGQIWMELRNSFTQDVSSKDEDSPKHMKHSSDTSVSSPESEAGGFPEASQQVKSRGDGDGGSPEASLQVKSSGDVGLPEAPWQVESRGDSGSPEASQQVKSRGDSGSPEAPWEVESSGDVGLPEASQQVETSGVNSDQDVRKRNNTSRDAEGVIPCLSPRQSVRLHSLSGSPLIWTHVRDFLAREGQAGIPCEVQEQRLREAFHVVQAQAIQSVLQGTQTHGRIITDLQDLDEESDSRLIAPALEPLSAILGDYEATCTQLHHLQDTVCNLELEAVNHQHTEHDLEEKAEAERCRRVEAEEELQIVYQAYIEELDRPWATPVDPTEVQNLRDQLENAKREVHRVQTALKDKEMELEAVASARNSYMAQVQSLNSQLVHERIINKQLLAAINAMGQGAMVAAVDPVPVMSPWAIPPPGSTGVMPMASSALGTSRVLGAAATASPGVIPSHWSSPMTTNIGADTTPTTSAPGVTGWHR